MVIVSEWTLIIKTALIAYTIPIIYKLFEKHPSALVAINLAVIDIEQSQNVNLQDSLKSGIAAIDDKIDNNTAMKIFQILKVDAGVHYFRDEMMVQQFIGLTSGAIGPIPFNIKLDKKTRVVNSESRDFEQQLIKIEAAEFYRSNESGQQYKAFITKPYLIAKYPITQDLYESVTGINPATYKGEKLPVEGISWFDAIMFCNLLSEKLDLDPIYDTQDRSNVIIDYNRGGFRLPTEAEWENAACPDSFSSEEIDQFAWYMSNSEMTTQEIGQKKANAFGLHDMLGNVWEWCNDWYSPYQISDEEDPHGPNTGEKKVRRGGSWVNFSNNIHPKYRDSSYPSVSDNHIGFRIVRNLSN